MLGFAEYEVQNWQNNLTFANETLTGTNITTVHAACIIPSRYVGRIELGQGQLASISFDTITVQGDSGTLCSAQDTKRFVFRTGHGDYFSLDTIEGNHALFTNLRELKTVAFSVSYERRGVRNVIFLNDLPE